MNLICLEHGDSPDSITLPVNHTKVDGTERDWHNVHFTVQQPVNSRLTENHITLSDPDYVEKAFDIYKVKKDLKTYFNSLVEDEDQRRLSERGTCSERSNPRETCFPEVIKTR
jgi:hypothetical protein